MARTAPSRAALAMDIPGVRKTPLRRRSSVDLDASSELNAAMAADEDFVGVPSSFATQMAMANAMLNKASQGDNDRMSRLMLAKMKTLEESLGDVVREMRVLRSTVPSTAHNSGDDGSGGGKPRRPMAKSAESSPGPALIEVAEGRDRNRGTGLRRSMTATSAEWRAGGRVRVEGEGSRKWKGKEKAVSGDGSSDVDDRDDDGGFDESRGESFSSPSDLRRDGLASSF